MDKIARVINGIFTAVITIFLTAMILLVFLNVVLRYGFNSGITESEELSRYIFVWIVFLGAIAAHKERGHLGVDLLVSRFPRGLQKIFYVIINIITTIVLLIVIQGSVKMAIINSNSYAPATGLPMSVLFYAGIFAGVCMIALNILHTIQFVFLDKNAPSWAKANEGGDE